MWNLWKENILVGAVGCLIRTGCPDLLRTRVTEWQYLVARATVAIFEIQDARASSAQTLELLLVRLRSTFVFPPEQLERFFLGGEHG